MTGRGQARLRLLLYLALASAIWVGLGFPPSLKGAAEAPTDVPHDSTGTTLYLPLIVNSPLPPAGLEVTQAVQQPGNPVMLIAGRPTHVRYTLTDETAYSGVQAFLYGTRDGSPLPGSPISASNNPRTLEPTANRADLYDTFNFELPVSWTDGTVVLWTYAENGTDYQKHEGPVSVTFDQADPLPIMVVPIAYTCSSGGTGTTTPASPFGYLDDLAYKMYPVPSTDLVVHTPVGFSGPCNDGQPYPASDLDVWWDLLSLVSSVWQTEGHPNRYYYGLVDLYCGGSCVAGYGWVGGTKAAVGWNGWNSSHNGASDTHAHEVGHNHGLSHAPGCNASNPDGTFPYLDGSGRAKIGNSAHPNFGFDIDTLTIKVYSAYYDFMSYCDPAWISDYNYEKLFDYAQAQAAMVPDIAGAPGSALLVSGSLRADGSVELQPAFTLEIPTIAPAPGHYTLELLDQDGQVLASHTFQMQMATVDSFGGGQGDETQGFQLAVPAVPGIETIRVVRDSHLLGELSRNHAQADLASLPAQAVIENSRLRISGNGAPGAAYLVRLSLDGGATWQTIAAGSAAAIGPVDLAGFSGRSVTVQILVSSGLDTQEVTLGPVQIP